MPTRSMLDLVRSCLHTGVVCSVCGMRQGDVGDLAVHDYLTQATCEGCRLGNGPMKDVRSRRLPGRKRIRGVTCLREIETEAYGERVNETLHEFWHMTPELCSGFGGRNWRIDRKGSASKRSWPFMDIDARNWRSGIEWRDPRSQR